MNIDRALGGGVVDYEVVNLMVDIKGLVATSLVDKDYVNMSCHTNFYGLSL